MRQTPSTSADGSAVARTAAKSSEVSSADARPAASNAASGDGATRLRALLALEKIAPGDPVAASKRRTLLLEWLREDFSAALAYCRATQSEDLADPVVAQFVAQGATIDQLAELISGSSSPLAVSRNLCEGAGVAKVQQLVAQTAGRYTGFAAQGFAAAVGGYLASKNIDAAIAFAVSRPGGELQATALASVVNQLGTEGKVSEAQLLYGTLDPAVRDTDPVKSAYGQSLHDADPELALGMLFSIADPATKREALVAFAQKIEANQPSVAVSALLAAGLSPEKQNAQVERIVTEWAHVDLAAAQEFLEKNAALSGELRDRLRAKIR